MDSKLDDFKGLSLAMSGKLKDELDDTVVLSVIEKFTERSIVGKRKYGVTLDRDDLSLHDWLVNLQEELMDATLYIEVLKRLINV